MSGTTGTTDYDGVGTLDDFPDDTALEGTYFDDVAGGGYDMTNWMAWIGSATEAVESDLTDHLTDTTDAHDASAISVVPAGQIAETDAQSALEGLDTRLSEMLPNSPVFLRDYGWAYDDFIQQSITSGSIGSLGWLLTVANSGNASQPTTPSANSPGQILLNTGAVSAAGAAGISLDPLAFYNLDASTLVWEARVMVVNLASAAQDFTVRVGLMDVVTGEPANGAWFSYSFADTHWIANVAGGSAKTSVATTQVVAGSVYYRLRIVCDGGGTVYFYVFDVEKASINDANVPTNLEGCGPAFSMIKSAGTASRVIRVDYMYLLYGVNR